MSWNKKFIDTNGYPHVEDIVGIFPSFSSCREHIEKHVLADDEPWYLVMEIKNPGKNCQITDEMAVEIYEKMVTEISRTVHFFFLAESYVYQELRQDRYKEKRVVGVGPFGLIVVASSQNVLSAYFPYKTSEAGGEFQRFWKALNIATKKIRLSGGKERQTTAERMNFSPQTFPWAMNKHQFQRFLEHYRQIDQQTSMREQLGNILKEKQL